MRRDAEDRDLTRTSPIEERAPEIIKRLSKAYPDAHVALNFTNPLECLVATILSAQCTDERVNMVTKGSVREVPDREGLPRGARGRSWPPDIKPTGFFNQKTKSIRGACARIVEVYGGKVPNTMEDLITLPGVARKTANIVLGNSYGVVEGIAVDTHVRRLGERLGFSAEKDPDKIEQRPDAPDPEEAMVRLHLRDHRPRPGDLRGSQAAMRRVPGERPLSVEPGVTPAR